jgi:hypothetical protein
VSAHALPDGRGRSRAQQTSHPIDSTSQSGCGDHLLRSAAAGRGLNIAVVIAVTFSPRYDTLTAPFCEKVVCGCREAPLALPYQLRRSTEALASQPARALVRRPLRGPRPFPRCVLPPRDDTAVPAWNLPAAIRADGVHRSDDLCALSLAPACPLLGGCSLTAKEGHGLTL